MKAYNYIFKLSFFPKDFLKAFLFIMTIWVYGAENNLDKVSLSLNNVSLFEAMQEIEAKTDFYFFYKNEDINVSNRVNLVVKEAPIYYVLEKLFDSKKITCKILGNKIVLKKNPISVTNKEYVLKGKVIDMKTGEPIPFCNVIIDGTYIGTSTNEEGNFIIKVGSIPIKLVFTHLNYENKTLEVTSEAFEALVKLTPNVNLLNEVVITNQSDKQALELAQRAYYKIKEEKAKVYGKAFYRQKSRNAEKYVELAEIIYDIEYDHDGINDWEILEGRYALNNEKSVTNKNFTLLTPLMKLTQPNTNDLIFPLNPQMESFYKINIKNTIKSGEDLIAVLSFTPKKKLDIPVFEGDVYISKTTFDVLKVSSSVFRDDFKLTKLTSKNSSWKNYKYSYEINYKKDPLSNVLLLDFIKLDQNFEYYLEDQFQFDVSTTSNLTFFEHYTPAKGKKLGGKYRKTKSDWERLNDIGYNKAFWDNNPIVQRTPVEEEIIASFEKDKAFGTIFINSREQIALLQSNIYNDTLVKSLRKNLTAYNNNNPIEKVYLHLNQEIVCPEETLWYSAYVTLGSYHQYSLASKQFHVDLIDSNNNIVTSQKHGLYYGKGKGSITIPKEISAGNYYLRAYTNWMRNENEAYFFSKPIKILTTSLENNVDAKTSFREIDLQFQPEGGVMVLGLNSLVAFKAIGKDGFGKEVKGRIVDSNNKPVTFLNTAFMGTGFFYLSPEPEEHYTAILDNGSKYNLPQPQKEGYVMAVDNSSKRSIQVKIQSTNSLKNKKFYVFAHMRNRIYFQARLEFGDEEQVTIEIPKTHLPSGVLTLSLFDETQKPWCERVVFVNNNEDLIIQTNLDKENFNEREKLELDISITDRDGYPVSTDVSVAVTDADQHKKDTESYNIMSYLLLGSEVNGYIENLSIFFNDNKSARRKQDLIMLTQGWRKLNWSKVRNFKDVPKKYNFSKGITISGIVKSSNGDLLKNSELNVIGKSRDNFQMYSVQTNANGKFEINNFNHTDSTQIVFNAYNKNKQLIDCKINLDSSNDLELPTPNYTFLNLYNESKFPDFVKNFPYRKSIDTISKETIKLDEIVLLAPIRDKRSKFSGADAIVYNDEDKHYLDIMQMLRTTGVRIYGTDFSTNVSIRGGGPPLWVLDGVKVQSENFEDPGFEYESESGDEQGASVYKQSTNSKASIPQSILALNVNEIDRIEVLKGPSGYMYGIGSGNGVISIYTKKGEFEEKIKSPEITFMGYDLEKEFYLPKYNVDSNNNITDKRVTLYWNPTIRTDKDGRASVIFYNSDIAKKIQIVVEGLSDYGVPGTSSKTFGEE